MFLLPPAFSLLKKTTMRMFVLPGKKGTVLFLPLLVLLLAVGVAVATSLWDSKNATSTTSFWDLDIFHLPADVAYPGTEWLNRIVATADAATGNPDKEETVAFTAADGTQYSSIYAAILQNDPTANPCRNMNAYINSIVFSPKTAANIYQFLGGHESMTLETFHYLLAYMRNFLAGTALYYAVGALFHYFCYIHPSIAEPVFAKRIKPGAAIMWDQIQLAQASMTIYTMLPVLDEYLIEQNYTAAYYTIQDVGGYGWFAFWFVVYMTCVEIGIYWMHRTLHTNKWMYKHIHLLHHKYNKPETLTPWASVAFHPLDGILQASPYVVSIFFVPCHYTVHLLLLFFTAVWATYIHDAMDWNIDPIMGSKYHTVHHTHYIYNYGQIFIFCDWFWGSLKVPDGPTGVAVNKQKTIKAE